MSRRDYFHRADAPAANSIVPAASAVILHGGHVLVQQRTDSGSWALPGGVMEIGESIATTCLREVREETGLDVRIERLVGVYSDPHHVIEYSNGEIRQQFSICFLCSVIAGDLTVSDESNSLTWLPLDRIEEMHPAQVQRVLDALYATKAAIR